MTLIKLCGMFRRCDIDFVNEAAPDYCGFIINFPKSHRSLTLNQVRVLAKGLAPGISPIGVLVDQPVELGAELLNDGTLAGVQLHGQEDDDYIAALRGLAGNKPVWKAFKIAALQDVAAANGSTADEVVLDNGCGTGKVFDWTLLKAVTRPFFLAGGLTPENLSAAVSEIRPRGVDLSSGLETNKEKDRNKILAAVAAVRDRETRKE